MLLTRERPCTSALLPMPAPLPSLRDALARRAAIFGPTDADPALVGPRGAMAHFAAALRSLADLIEPVRVPL